eukprot:6442887-Alexandrium_andersonii.AAC.1
MSASLVGSEMCIRDRAGAALQAKMPLRSNLGCRDAAPPRRSVGVLSPVACLLYTSDAADDM